MSEKCGINNNRVYGPDTIIKCGAPAEHTVTISCVHEHVTVYPICDLHYDAYQQAQDQGRDCICRKCGESSTKPHRCVCTLVFDSPVVPESIRKAATNSHEY